MKLEEIVHSDAEIRGGTPVFVGTRVPVILLDYLEGGEPLEEFLIIIPPSLESRPSLSSKRPAVSPWRTSRETCSVRREHAA
jgi:hypothetical protein